MAFDLVRHFQKFDFSKCCHAVVAVSGGSDSLGLLFALHEYFRSLSVSPKLSAVTVDHAMRQNSAHEAAGVAALCAQLKIPHVTKTWSGAKPISGIQAAARDERRALLCLAATELGADAILTGHTNDDQIETVMMRQRRGAGPGLAGIGHASLAYDDRTDGCPIWIVRPLLDVSRADIRAYLLANHIQWVDDPSNENDAFERVMVRKELQSSSDAFRQQILNVSRDAAIERIEVAGQAAALCAMHVQEILPGLVRIGAGAFLDAPNSVLQLLLRTLMAYTGGESSSGDAAIAEGIMQQVNSAGFAKGLTPWRDTSNGTLIEIRQSGVYLMREQRNQSVASDEFSRFYRHTKVGRTLEPVFKAPHTVDVPPSLLRMAQSRQSDFEARDGGRLPAFEAWRVGFPVRRVINPWPDLVPVFDVELAKMMSVMAGTGDFPDLPVYRHGKN
jgi:tRNA(Ile)-lysidine synthase